jgi:transcriptional regulatory protein RtcR
MRQWVEEGNSVKISMRVSICGLCPAGPCERREDIAPNVEYELQRFLAEARRRSASIKTRANAIWPLPVPAGAVARQLSRTEFSIARMATLAEQGRITLANAEEEIAVCRRLADTIFIPL